MTSLGRTKEFIAGIYKDGAERLSSNNVKNKSTVPGSSVSTALDYLLNNSGGGVGDAYLPVGAGTAGQHLRTDGTTASWSNLIDLSPGTLGSPGLKFVGDTDTGLFSPATGTFALVCDGTTEMTLSSTGLTANTLITSPKLKITNNVAIGNILVSDATGEFFATSVQTTLQSSNSFGSNTLIGDHAGTNGSGFDYVVAIGQNSFGGFAGMPTSATSGTVAIGLGALYSITSGARNSAIGFNSQATIATGSDNTTYGFQAMANGNGAVSNCTAFGSQTLAGALTTGANGATAFGYRALNALSSGFDNTAIGKDSQKNITTGSSNTTVGFFTMGQSANNVSNCVAIGDYALGGVLVSTSNGSVAVGTYALTALVGGINTAIGYNSQSAITTGTGNTTLGYATMDQAQSGVSYCTAFGDNALGGTLTTGANGSCAFGFEALKSLTSGTQNTCIGYTGQQAITTGSQNTTVGFAVMDGAGSAVSNCVGIGAQALSGALTTGANGATAVGASALTALTSGTLATAFGYNALGACTTGSQNCAFGYSAGSVIVGGYQNTLLGNNTQCGGSAGETVIIGYGAGGTSVGSTAVAVGSDCGHGSANSFVAIGRMAMNGVSTTGANGTVAIGASALFALTSGGGNTAIGYSSGSTLTTGSNNTLYGYNTAVDAVGRAGCVVIGKDGVSTADNEFSLALGGTNTFRSLMRQTAKGASTATVPADCDYLIVSIVPAGGGAPITRYMPLYTTA